MNANLVEIIRTISSALWIVGMFIFLASFSYVEFISFQQKIKRKKAIKTKPLIISFSLGLLLIFGGTGSSFVFYNLTPLPDPSMKKEVFNFPSARLHGARISQGLAIMESNGAIQTQELEIDKGRYKISIVSISNDPLGETARLKINLGDELLEDYYLSTEFEEKIIKYNSQKKENKSLIIEYVNDYLSFEDGKKLDRNAWIQSITITKEPDIPNKEEFLFHLLLKKLVY